MVYCRIWVVYGTVYSIIVYKIYIVYYNYTTENNFDEKLLFNAIGYED